MASTTFTIINNWALGDTICLSALARDLYRAHGDRYKLHARKAYQCVWKNNPWIDHEPTRATQIPFEYAHGIRASNNGTYPYHFLTYFHKEFERRTRIKVPVTEPRGSLHMGDDEGSRLIEGRYWVVVAGGKTDVTTKWWEFARWQAVVDRLAIAGIKVVQVGGRARTHVHNTLDNCLSVLGMTHERELFRVIRDCEGVICGVTAAMHIAAVFNKPCVSLAGGREKASWEAYTNEGQWPSPCGPVTVPHRYLSNIGELPCCNEKGSDGKPKGCWKKWVEVPASHASLPSPARDKDVCRQPIKLVGGGIVPKCMDMISVDRVVAEVLSYGTSRDGLPIVWKGRPEAPPAPPLPVRATKAGEAADGLLDDPAIGGKFTVFVLCYGNYPELAKSCIGSILERLPADRMDLRIGANQVCEETKAYLATVPATKVYYDDGKRLKYEAMREMFNDPEHPITTPYLLWFDDDTKIVHVRWLETLAMAIVSNHSRGGRLYGRKLFHDYRPYPRGAAWFGKDAPWHRGKPWCLPRSGAVAPNGTGIPFVAGYFWAAHVPTLRAAGVPDARLVHNGGDITIGGQVHQMGGKIIQFNSNKEFVWCPPKAGGGRRGTAHPLPWTTPDTIR